jgi:hypothetical protein
MTYLDHERAFDLNWPHIGTFVLDLHVAPAP